MLNCWILVISYDKNNDQIFLENSSESFQNQFLIKNAADFRKFSRKILVENKF